MDFQQAQDFLDDLQMHKIKLGLESMESFLREANDPHEKLRFIHVAGTNGKGSVCATLAQVLQQSGYSVGLYTSPHLNDVRERFKINDTFIEKEEFVEIVQQIKQLLGERKITYFECATAIALLWFAKRKPDLVILETGMGGRLDATNVVTPLFSIITNISLDHQQYLGETIPAVTAEKAGIIKQTIPVISGVKDNRAIQVIEKIAKLKQSPLYQLNRDFDVKSDGEFWRWWSETSAIEGAFGNLKSNLQGDYQHLNGSLVIAATQLLVAEHGFNIRKADLYSGLLEVKWPGRQEQLFIEKSVGGQKCRIEFLLDGAHNAAGVASLLQSLETRYSTRTIHLIWGAMADKIDVGTLPAIGPYVEQIILTSPDSSRSASPDEIFVQLSQSLQGKCCKCATVGESLRKIVELSEPGQLVVVAGSLYLVGEMRELLVGKVTGD